MAGYFQGLFVVFLLLEVEAAFYFIQIGERVARRQELVAFKFLRLLELFLRDDDTIIELYLVSGVVFSADLRWKGNYLQVFVG